MNTYGYALQNPLKFKDIFGLDVTININRDTYTPNTITGKITVTSDRVSKTFSGYTLEDQYAGDAGQKLPIPEGSYTGFLRYSRGSWRIEFYDVYEFKNIQIHKGNTREDVKGCFAVGKKRGKDNLAPGTSKPALDEILDLINLDGTDVININVTGKSY